MEGKVVETFLQLDKTVSDCQEDLTRFAHGNKSAGTRLRKAMQRVKQLAQKVRVEIQEQKNTVSA